jgi:hypothetical protein
MEPIEYALRLAKICQTLEEKVQRLEQQVSALQTSLTNTNCLFEWIKFRASSEYCGLVESLADMGFAKKHIERILASTYDPKLPYDDLIRRVTMQLSTKDLYRG